MVVKKRFQLLARRALLLLFLAGVSGLESCTQHFHPQYAHAIGGGTIGKGPTGKKRGIQKRADDSGRMPGFGADPVGNLLSTPKPDTGKRKVSALDAARARANKPAKAENPFATSKAGKSGSLGSANPFAQR